MLAGVITTAKPDVAASVSVVRRLREILRRNQWPEILCSDFLCFS